MLGKGTEGVSAIANATGLSRQAVYRIKDERSDMEAALAAWGM
jgi:putative DNA-invertase from lambdoid prophage Rac